MCDTLKFFLLGMFGAIVPEILRLYKIKDKKLALTAHYFVICPLFALVGGVVAVILPATTPWGAFYIGLSAETLISTIGKNGGDSTPAPHPSSLNIGNKSSNGNKSRKSSWKVSFKNYFNAL